MKPFTARTASLALMFLFAVGAALLVPFFRSSNTAVVILALIAWASLIVAIRKMPLPRSKPKE